MAGLRDIKRQARRDLHREAQVPALYLAARDADPVSVGVRLHLKFGNSGSLAGNQGWAEVADEKPKIVFLLAEVAPVRGALVSVEAGEAYRLERLLPIDDEFQTVEVTRLGAEEAAGLPVPGSA